MNRRPLVDVYVGPEKKHYPLPKLLLIHHSKFFEKCFNGQFKEGQTQKLDLPEDKVFHFDILIEYMSRGNPSLVVNAAGNKAFIIRQCMDFIQYAGKYDLWEATSAVYEPLNKAFLQWGPRSKGQLPITGLDIETVFRVVPAGHSLRTLIAAAALSFGGISSSPFRAQEEKVEGFAAEMLRQFRNNVTAAQFTCPIDKTKLRSYKQS